MIFHKKIKKDDCWFYLCNQAVTPTMRKTKYNWKDVTCKNCLKQKEKQGLE